jgi:hypothetical protein
MRTRIRWRIGGAGGGCDSHSHAAGSLHRRRGRESALAPGRASTSGLPRRAFFAAVPRTPPKNAAGRYVALSSLRNVTTSTSRKPGCTGSMGSTGVTPCMTR